jgi:hypothetical protein
LKNSNTKNKENERKQDKKRGDSKTEKKVSQIVEKIMKFRGNT